jgi:cardiolipin synthase
MVHFRGLVTGMGLPNWLTILRILLIPVFVSLLVYRRPGVALAVFCLASLTDLLDGYVARRRGSQSRLGAFLDPMADKLLLTASFVTLTYLRALPFWITAVVISRDVILVLGAVLIHMTGGQVSPAPTRAGKLSTFFQILTVLAAMLTPYLHARSALRVTIWITAAFTVFSGLQYITRGMGFLNAPSTAEREHEDSLLR